MNYDTVEQCKIDLSKRPVSFLRSQCRVYNIRNCSSKKKKAELIDHICKERLAHLKFLETVPSFVPLLLPREERVKIFERELGDFRKGDILTFAKKPCYEHQITGVKCKSYNQDIFGLEETSCHYRLKNVQTGNEDTDEEMRGPGNTMIHLFNALAKIERNGKITRFIRSI